MFSLCDYLCNFLRFISIVNKLNHVCTQVNHSVFFVCDHYRQKKESNCSSQIIINLRIFLLQFTLMIDTFSLSNVFIDLQNKMYVDQTVIETNLSDQFNIKANTIHNMTCVI